jgi:hypothetical protein
MNEKLSLPLKDPKQFKLTASYNPFENPVRKPNIFDYISDYLYFFLTKFDVWSKPRKPSKFISILSFFKIKPSFEVLHESQISRMAKEIRNEIINEISKEIKV